MKNGNTKIIRNIIIIVIFLIIILLGAFAYLYFFTDTLKTNKQLFFKYASQIAQEDGFINKNIEEYYKKQKETPYENSGVFQVKLEANNAEKIANALNECYIDFSGKTDSVNQKSEQNIEIHYSDDVTWPMIYRQDKDIYGIQIDNVATKYISIENNNLKELFEKLGVADVSSIPDKIEVTQQVESLEFTDEDKKSLIEKYKNVLDKELKEEQFKKEKAEDKTTTYALTLTYEELRNILVALLNELKTDEIILGKIDDLLEEISNSEKDVLIDREDIDSIISEIQEAEIEEGEIQILISQKDNLLQNIAIKDKNLEVNIGKEKEEEQEQYYIEIIIGQGEEQKAKIYFSSTYAGLNNLQNVTETYELGLEINDSNTISYEYNFENNLKFVEGIEIEDLTQSNAIILNQYEAEPLQNFMNAVGQRIIDINNSQMEEIDFENGNPLLYALPTTLILQTMIYNQTQNALYDGSWQSMDDTSDIGNFATE